jgi:Ca2+-binding RTX toxin-like protein
VVVGLTAFQPGDFIFASSLGPSVSVTVQTPDGYDFSTLYGDLAASNPLQSANDANHIFAVDAAKGITFEMIGTNIYDTVTHQPVAGGVITEIDILNTTNPTQTMQDHVLVNTNGWSIDASVFFSAIGAYAANNNNTGSLNGIFNAATYSIVGSAGFADNNGPSHSGADVFFGGDHADVFNGMPGPFGPGDLGNDTVDYSHASTGVTVDLLHPANNLGAALGDTFISIENLRGTAFDDTLTGDGNNNVLEGGLGHNTLNGGTPGGAGDTVSYEHATASVTVNLSLSTPQNTIGAGIDTLSNFQILLGSSHDDILTGNGSSIIEGGLGNDQINGQFGGQDTASYQHATSGVTVSLMVSGPQNTGGAGSDSLSNIANLFGSQFSDNLTGDNNANRLDGGFGSSDAHDTLTGLGGADTFVFNTGHVTITDFTVGEDVVDVLHAHNGSPFTTAEVTALIAASAGNTIDFGNNNLLTFTGITVSTQLHAADFLHVA